MSYQPLLGLSWKYEIGTGKLFITSIIRVDLAANEHMNVSSTPVINNSVIINVDIVAGVNNSPVTNYHEFYNIGQGLTSVDVVRRVIELLPHVTVNAFVNVSPTLQYKGSGTTSSRSEIIIV